MMGRIEKTQAAKDTAIMGPLASNNKLVITENATKTILAIINNMAVFSRVVKATVLEVSKRFTWIIHCLKVSNKSMQT